MKQSSYLSKLDKNMTWLQGNERLYFVFAAMVIFFSLLSHFPAVTGGFFGDDLAYVVNNDVLKSITAGDLWVIFFSRTNPYEYLPLRDLSYWLDISVFGLNPIGFHLHNLVLYGLTCFAVWHCAIAILRLFGDEQTIGSNEKFLAFAITAIFAVHPAHVESVAWISGRKDLLSGLFTILTLQQFTLVLLDRFRNLWRLGFAYFLFALALLSKSTVVPLPLVLLFLAMVYSLKSDSSSEAWWKPYVAIIPYGVLSLFSVMTQLAIGAQTRVTLNPFVVEIFRSQSQFELPAKILGYFTNITFAPFSLRILYDLDNPVWKAVLSLILGGMTLLAFIYAIVKVWRSKSLAAFGVILFVSFALPFLQFLPFATWSYVSERFLFMPVFGFSIFCAVLIGKLPHGRETFLFVLLAIGLFGLVDRSKDWQNPPRSLWTANIRHNSSSFQSVTKIIQIIYIPEGKFKEAHLLTANIESDLARKALEVYIDAAHHFQDNNYLDRDSVIGKLKMYWGKSDDVYPLILLGRLSEKNNNDYDAARYYYYGSKGIEKTSKADLARIEKKYNRLIEKYNNEIVRRPGDLNNYLQLADLYMEIFQLEKSSETYKKVLHRIQNEYHKGIIHYNIGLCAFRGKNYEEAIDEFEIAYKKGLINKDLWNNIGLSFMYLGRIEEAESAFLEAMRLDTLFVDAAYNLGAMKLSLGENGHALDVLYEAKKRMLAKGKPTDLVDLKIKYAEMHDD